jgi:hypothetical protein
LRRIRTIPQRAPGTTEPAGSADQALTATQAQTGLARLRVQQTRARISDRVLGEQWPLNAGGVKERIRVAQQRLAGRDVTRANLSDTTTIGS